MMKEREEQIYEKRKKVRERDKKWERGGGDAQRKGALMMMLVSFAMLQSQNIFKANGHEIFFQNIKNFE